MLRCRGAFRIFNSVLDFNKSVIRFQKPILKEVAKISFCSCTHHSSLLNKKMEENPSNVEKADPIAPVKPQEDDDSTTVQQIVDKEETKKRQMVADDTVQSSEQEHKKLKQDNSDNTETVTEVVSEARLRRRKIAILLCYSGQGYYGMQINRGEPQFKTIEGELARALKDSGVISEEESNDFKRLRFQRSSRTDKGVSAARQVVSMKIGLPDDIEEKINAHLPPQIRIVAVTRVTQGFDSKNWASSRTYSYVLPSLAFCPSDQVTTPSFRMNDDILDNVNQILSIYKGTKNFHNFTSGVTFKDKSAMRYIMEFECGKPFMRNGMEFAAIEVQGQSFMLHQIRKMIGLMIAVVRGMASKSVYDKVFLEEKMDIPKAPGLGLLLERIHYLYYNRRYGNDGIHEALEWNDKNDLIEKFKEEFIYSTIINTELREQSMLEWLQTIIIHRFDTIVRNPYVDAYKPIAQQKSAQRKEKDALSTNNTNNDAQTESTDNSTTITKTDELTEDPSSDEKIPTQDPIPEIETSVQSQDDTRLVISAEIT